MQNVYVVIQFYPWFKFYSLLFLGIVMYDNEFETKELKFEPRIKLNHNIYNITYPDLLINSAITNHEQLYN